MDYAEKAGLSLAWARLFFLYGPFEPKGRLVPSVVQGLLRHQRVPCTSGEQMRDYLHVSDAAHAFAALLASDVRGAVNIASGVPVSIKSIVDTLADSIGHPELIDWGAIPMPPEQPPVLFGEIRKLRRETGWTPAIPLEEGLRATVQWWREQGRSG
jgi:UDP-glucose 4-epimerase